MISNILFDFDGVILDSMPVRDKGFKLIFEKFPSGQVDALMQFHKANGGLSRYVKIRYFFETVRGESITAEEVLQYAETFSAIMLKELTSPSLLINDTVDFIKNNYQNYQMHIVSGSDQEELRYLCKIFGIDKYFKTIAGSPVEKKILVDDILKEFKYVPGETILIGDSENDRDAALTNKIEFWGYNNPELVNPEVNKYIHKLSGHRFNL